MEFIPENISIRILDVYLYVCVYIYDWYDLRFRWKIWVTLFILLRAS